jgi:DNA-binding HxlR family transcriptional regulator
MSKAYGQDCLIARVLDVVGDRWTLLVVRELMLGKQRFTDILEGCGKVSPNLLSDRLKKLEANRLGR